VDQCNVWSVPTSKNTIEVKASSERDIKAKYDIAPPSNIQWGSQSLGWRVVWKGGGVKNSQNLLWKLEDIKPAGKP